MATRRIARGRGGSPVPIIIMSVITVGLITGIVVLALSVGDTEKNLARVQEEVKTEKQNAQKQLDTFHNLENYVGFSLEGAGREYATLKQDLEGRAPLPAWAVPEGATKEFKNLKTLVSGYADRCVGLEKVVTKIEGELKTAKEQCETAVRDGEEKAKTKEKQTDLEKAAAVKLREEKATVEKERDSIREKLTAEVEDLKGRNTKLTKDVAAALKDVTVWTEKHSKLAERYADLERAGKKTKTLGAGIIPEPPDGKVLTVDADGTHVMVDIGRKDWVEVGMFFTIFEKGSEDARKQKGQVQIRQVHDEISRAKVIKQDELDPILPGMLAVNPAFKRGTKLEFRLKGRFLEPRIEQLLSRYPCTLAEKVSVTTDYLVLGDAKPDEAKGEASWDEDEEVITAKNEYKVTIMRERELLNYLGERQ